jgi:ribonuclease P protein component
MVEEAPREAHIPAQQPPPRQAPRLPASHGDPRRPQRPAGAAPQGSAASLGLIWRIRDRRTFVELRRRGRRARHGHVSVTHLPAAPIHDGDPPRVAFAIPRKVGGAVVRNRLRRQMRAHLARRSGEVAMSGAYLVALGPGAASVPGSELLADLDTCLERAEPRR